MLAVAVVVVVVVVVVVGVGWRRQRQSPPLPPSHRHALVPRLLFLLRIQCRDVRDYQSRRDTTRLAHAGGLV